MSKQPQWREYDHLEVSALENPGEYLDTLRAENPIGYSDKYGGFYVLTRYADCIAAGKDPRLSSSPDLGPGSGFPFKHHDLLRMPMTSDDGQRHRDFRMPLQMLFSPKCASAQTIRVREICNDLIDTFIETGVADLADQYSIELPAVLIAELLDLPHERRRQFQGWASSMVAAGDMEAGKKIADYTEELYHLRKENPGEDIPSKMLSFSIEGRAISKDEWRGLVMLLVLGGLDTTANGGGYAFHMIGKRPELRRYLLEDPSRIQKSLKEFLRIINPVPAHSRGITEDLEIGGHQFRKGDVVQLNWMAANHDPEVFSNPHVFDPDRKVDHHLAFGSGPHRCLGNYLALVEMQIMIEQVLSRIPDYELVEGGTERFGSLNRGMRHLRVTFTPGKRSSAR